MIDMSKPRLLVAGAAAALALTWVSAAPMSSAATSPETGKRQIASCSTSIGGSGGAVAQVQIQNPLADGNVRTDSPL